MGLFSFLSGGKKKEEKATPVKAAVPAAQPAVAKAEPAPAPVKTVAPPPPAPPELVATSVAQAKLRLKLAASLRAGQHQVAYEAATGLAAIQVRAGRPTVARVWQVQAERIKAGLAA